MSTEFKVFHGVGAIIAQVTSHTKFSVFAIVNDKDKIDFSTTERMFVVDLGATPGTVQTFAGSAIRFDDRGVDDKGKELPLDNVESFPRGRGTTIGSGTLEDMMSGTFIGTVYIERDHFNVIRKTAIDPKPWPPKNSLQLYQITSVTYSLAAANGPRAGHRYHGYRGTVTDVTDTDFGVVFQDKPGGSVIGPHRFRLGDANQYDGDPPSSALDGAPSIAASPITRNAQGALFVALKYAAELELADGKIPIGLGAGPGHPVAVPALEQPLPRNRVLPPEPGITTRINLSPTSGDEGLVEVMGQIDGEILVDGTFGASGVEGVVKDRLIARAAAGGGCTLDLIAHAANGVLQFGDWLIDDQDQNGRVLRDRWGPLKPTSIRLLGCNTAELAGTSAMRHLAEVFQVPVFGTTRPLYAKDFDAAGLAARAELKLVEIDSPRPVGDPRPVGIPVEGRLPGPRPIETSLPVGHSLPGGPRLPVEPPPPVEYPGSFDTSLPTGARVSDEQVERWFQWFDPVTTTDAQEVYNRLRAETLDRATRDVQRTRPRYRWPVRQFAAEDRQRLFAQLIPELATAPGLLAVPDWLQPDSEFEALFPAASSVEEPRFHRATILLGGRFVRIYPIDVPGGVILRSSRPVRLEGGVAVPVCSTSTQGA